jgi:hypothetical protein
MLLEALVACAGVTLRAVATSLGISVESGSVHAEGELDFRGTLAVDRMAPAGRWRPAHAQRDARLSAPFFCSAMRDKGRERPGHFARYANELAGALAVLGGDLLDRAHGAAGVGAEQRLDFLQVQV